MLMMHVLMTDSRTIMFSYHFTMNALVLRTGKVVVRQINNKEECSAVQKGEFGLLGLAIRIIAQFSCQNNYAQIRT